MTAAKRSQPVSLTVRAGDREWSVALTELDAVIECPPVTVVPAAPRWLIGVAAYEGRLLPVVDLAACLDQTDAAPPGPRLLLVESGAHRIGFSVAEILSESSPDPAAAITPAGLRALAAELLKSSRSGKESPQLSSTAP